MIYKCLLILLFSATLFSEESELVVRLETECQLTPLHFTSIEHSHSALDASYVDELEKIFRFDLNHNGNTTLVSEKSFYEILLTITEHSLLVQLKSSDGEESMEMRDLFLSGYLSEDRRLIHRVADAVHRQLFGAPGVTQTRILYTVRSVEEGKEYSEVWQSDYDGANARQITQRSAGYCVTPAYIPPRPGDQANQFFYVSYETGIPKIYLASIHNGKGKRFFTLSGNQLMPTMNRQRDHVAFISDAAGNPDLFIQPFSPEKGPQGIPRHLYSARYAVQGTPSFSPEGQRIAFVSNKGGSPRIYVMAIPPKGTPLREINPVLITKYNRENTAPCWSPDGTKLAYCSKTKGIRQIWVYDFLAGVERQLTDGKHHKENPTWAPNSLHLMYNTSDAGACELYLINLKQAKASKVSSGPGEKRFPTWEPRVSMP